MGGLVTEWLWLYNGQPTRFFKTPNGLVSDKRPWPYNRGNTVPIIGTDHLNVPSSKRIITITIYYFFSDKTDVHIAKCKCDIELLDCVIKHEHVLKNGGKYQNFRSGDNDEKCKTPPIKT